MPRDKLAAERDRMLSLLLTPPSRFTNLFELPDDPGLYTLLARSRRCISDLHLEDVKTELPLLGRALYLGKAEDSLVKRVACYHFATGKTGHSSLRRTLAALLKLESCPRPSKITNPTAKQLQTMTTNFGLRPSAERQLTEWMLRCVEVRAIVTPWIDLGELERAVGAELRPPLDQERRPLWSPNPWREQVTDARRRLQAKARQVAGLPW